MYLLSKVKSVGPLNLGDLVAPNSKGPIGMGEARGLEGRAMK